MVSLDMLLHFIINKGLPVFLRGLGMCVGFGNMNINVYRGRLHLLDRGVPKVAKYRAYDGYYKCCQFRVFN